MRSSFVTKSAASLVVLALAAGGLGCAAPGDDAPAPAAESSTEGSIGKTQQDMVVFQVLSGIQGIWQVTGMIQQTVEYGKPIGAVNAYEETVRLRSDIAALSQSVDTQFNQVLIAIDASDLREIISASEDYWNTMQTLQPGGEAAFFEDVRRQGKLTFGELARLDTILMGSDGLGSGLVAKTMNTMRIKYSDGSPNDSKANVLGELMLRMRLAQLQAFEVLSRAYSSSGTYVGYMDIAAKRAEFLKRLDNQGNVFFEQMRSFNQWQGDAYVRWWAEVSPAEAPYERNGYLDMVYTREEVLRGWNAVPEGMSLDMAPALGIVSAKYSAWDVGGSLAQVAMHKASANITFSTRTFGVSTSAPAQAPLTIEYRCEGQPGTRTVTIPDANGKTFTLECSNLDRFVGTYVDSPVTNTFIAEVTKRDATHLLYKGSDKKIWSLAVTADPQKFLVSSCYKADWDPTGIACYPDDPADAEYWTANVIDSETRDPGAISLEWNGKTVKKVPAGWTNPRD